MQLLVLGTKWSDFAQTSVVSLSDYMVFLRTADNKNVKMLYSDFLASVNSNNSIISNMAPNTLAGRYASTTGPIQAVTIDSTSGIQINTGNLQFSNQNASYVLASPTLSSGKPTWRQLTAVDITNAESQNNKGAANGYAPLNSSLLLPTSYIPTNLKASAFTTNITGSNLQRSLYSRFSDFGKNLIDLGAKLDNTTDDTAVWNASSGIVYVPPGISVYSNSLLSLPEGRWFGPGNIKTNEGSYGYRTQANNIAVINTAKSFDETLEYDVTRSFSADMSKVHLNFQTFINGADTLGTPPGYSYYPPACGIYGMLVNNSGYNSSTDIGGPGRTSATASRIRVVQQGKGDCVAYNAAAYVAGDNSGSSVAANAAGSLFNGDIAAGKDGIYLNAREILLNDNGYDVSGIGDVINMSRNNNTGAKKVSWTGYRAQSIGTKAVDSILSAQGPFRIGIDLTSAIYTTNAAITIGPTQGIYFNSQFGVSGFSNTTMVRNTFISCPTPTSSLNITANGALAAQFGTTSTILNALQSQGGISAFGATVPLSKFTFTGSKTDSINSSNQIIAMLVSLGFAVDNRV